MDDVLQLVDALNDVGLEHGLAVGLDPVPGTCIPSQAGGSKLVHRPQSKPPAFGIVSALACGEVAALHPTARLTSSALFPGVENRG